MIKVEGVSRRWPEFALDNLTLEARAGEYLVIVGPTGSGKTLLLETLLGIHAPDTGRIFLAGKDMTAAPPERRGIGMVYQDYVLFPHLTVGDNIGFGLRYTRFSAAEQRTRIAETAELLGIARLLHRYPRTLSGGERQRVAIGRAVATDPRILLLDEPLGALDRNTAQRLRGELRNLHSVKNLTTIHVTHDFAEARAVGDRVGLLRGGALHAIATPEELFRRPPTLFAAEFAGAVNVYEARVEEDLVRVGPIAVPAAPKSKTAHIVIHPAEVALARDGSGAVNGEVTAIADEGDYCAARLRVEGLPGPLTVYLSRRMVESLALTIGARVTADVNGASHVIWS